MSSQHARDLAIGVLCEHFHARSVGLEGPWHILEIGSRSHLRTWGLWGRDSYKHLPIRIILSASEVDGETTLVARLVNDEGPYAFRLPRVVPSFQRRFVEISDALSRAFDPLAPTSM